jgi:hypothetical protein
VVDDHIVPVGKAVGLEVRTVWIVEAVASSKFSSIRFVAKLGKEIDINIAQQSQTKAVRKNAGKIIAYPMDVGTLGKTPSLPNSNAYAMNFFRQGTKHWL